MPTTRDEAESTHPPPPSAPKAPDVSNSPVEFEITPEQWKTFGFDMPPPLRRPIKNLAWDKILRDLTSVQVGAFSVPVIGGIPLLNKLGQGGMGAVYYGVHPRLQCEVAVKILPMDVAARAPELIQRFMREARIAAQVRSPHLVSVLDVHTQDDVNYLVQEYIHGETASRCYKLAKEAAERNTSIQKGLAETQALDIIIAATRGLAIAHAHNVVHRDIKPDNILVPRDRDGKLLFAEAKLADLGLARQAQVDQSLTGTEAAMGTPGYMSPEQAMETKSVGPAADVYSMGATLYALLTGKPPFGGNSAVQVLMATCNERPKPITQFRPDLTPQTVQTIDICLAKTAEERPADGAALLRILEAAHRASGALATAGQPQTGVTPTGSDEATIVSKMPPGSVKPGSERWVRPDSAAGAASAAQSAHQPTGHTTSVVPPRNDSERRISGAGTGTGGFVRGQVARGAGTSPSIHVPPSSPSHPTAMRPGPLTGHTHAPPRSNASFMYAALGLIAVGIGVAMFLASNRKAEETEAAPKNPPQPNGAAQAPSGANPADSSASLKHQATAQEPAPVNPGAAATQRPPVAVLQKQKETYDVNATVKLDASKSSDPDGDRLTFIWSWSGIGHRPAISTSPDGANAQFNADKAGIYGVQLVVADKYGNKSDPQRMQVEVTAQNVGEPSVEPKTEPAPVEPPVEGTAATQKNTPPAREPTTTTQDRPPPPPPGGFPGGHPPPPPPPGGFPEGHPPPPPPGGGHRPPPGGRR